MTTKTRALHALVLIALLLLPFPAAGQSGAVRPGQNKVPIRTVADDVIEREETPVTATGQSLPPAAKQGNSLSPEAKILIAVAVITTVSIIAAARRKKRVCGPLSGCPLF